jgi:hypothetical protein
MGITFILLALLIGFIAGGVFGYLMGKDALVNNFEPLGKKRTGKSFADRLYEGFQYPPYLTPGTSYNFPVSAERKTGAFGNVLLGSPNLCCLDKHGGPCHSEKCPEGCDCDKNWDVNWDTTLQ